MSKQKGGVFTGFILADGIPRETAMSDDNLSDLERAVLRLRALRTAEAAAERAVDAAAEVAAREVFLAGSWACAPSPRDPEVYLLIPATQATREACDALAFSVGAWTGEVHHALTEDDAVWVVCDFYEAEPGENAMKFRLEFRDDASAQAARIPNVDLRPAVAAILGARAGEIQAEIRRMEKALAAVDAHLSRLLGPPAGSPK